MRRLFSAITLGARTALLSRCSLALNRTTINDALDYSLGLADNGYYAEVKASEIVILPDISFEDIYSDVLEDYSSDESFKSYVDTTANIQFAQLEDKYGEEISIDGERIPLNWRNRRGNSSVRKAQKGDFANISYSVVHFQKYDGCEGADIEFKLDSSFPEDSIENQIIGSIYGHVPGDAYEVEVTFPADTQPAEGANGTAVELAGKTAVFYITINDIYIKEINDENMAEMLKDTEYRGISTIEELMSRITGDVLYESAVNRFESEFVSLVDVEIPEDLVDIETVKRIISFARDNGIKTEADIREAAKGFGFDDYEAYKERNREFVTEQIKRTLVAQAVCEREGYSISEKDILLCFGDMQSYNDACEMFSKEYVNQQIMIEHAFSSLETIEEAILLT